MNVRKDLRHDMLCLGKYGTSHRSVTLFLELLFYLLVPGVFRPKLPSGFTVLFLLMLMCMGAQAKAAEGGSFEPSSPKNYTAYISPLMKILSPPLLICKSTASF
ncbi:hypothetical protein H5410_038115 [Solanum commersonii]|uniref:Uncharacterized protein n=1 Tax=Solanum commersonii TaxID=4109 RepID=A0A9J5Y843_SOLCO|nr:hypothetical protein H5410_038115 [Solanum commersonii]